MTRITFKITNQEQTVVIDADLNTVGTVLGLKNELAAKTNSNSSNIKLIHKGIQFTQNRKNFER